MKVYNNPTKIPFYRQSQSIILWIFIIELNLKWYSIQYVKKKIKNRILNACFRLYLHNFYFVFFSEIYFPDK